MSQRIPLLIDTDPGVDDALALLMAFNDPRHDVVRHQHVERGATGRILEQPLAIRSKLAELGKDARVHIYDQAGHGFVNRPEESAASAAAAEDAWRRTVQLFQTTL